MERSRQIVIVSHCILNTNSKVESEVLNPAMIKEVIDTIHNKNLGIIQLPCPEMLQYGMKRWGHVKEQFDTVFFRQNCKTMLLPIIQQIIEYKRCHYEIKAVLGIDYSPSCGVNITCSSNEYIGELNLAESLSQLENSVTTPNAMGVFMEEFQKMLKENNLEIPFIGINELKINDSLDKINNL